MKYENLLNIETLTDFAKNHEAKLKENIPADVQAALNLFMGKKKTEDKTPNILPKNLNVYIYLKSITFRDGRSSVKIGAKKFKATFNRDNQEMFDVKTFSGTSHLSKLARFALLALLNDPSRVKKESDKTEKIETTVANNASAKIKQLIEQVGAEYIIIKMGDEEFKVDGFRQVQGRPKTDLTFTYKGQDVIFISHKYGAGAVNVQQYGGIAYDLGMEQNSRTKFSSHLDKSAKEEIQKFLSNVDKILEKNYPNSKLENGTFDFSKLSPGVNFATPVNSRTIAELVIFGKDYGSQFFGMNNAHVLIDGDIVLEKETDGVYFLKGSSHTIFNPKIKGVADKLHSLSTLGEYQPMLMIARSGNQGLNQGGFKNARGYIWPNNDVAKRYNQRYITDLRSI